MKILAAVVLVQLFLLVTEATNTLPEERKRVACFFHNFMTDKYGSISLENIPASLCTHLIVSQSFIMKHREEIENISTRGSDSDGIIQKFAKLKEVNPDLKLLLQVPFPRNMGGRYGSQPGSSERNNYTEDAITNLKSIGFDGLDYAIDTFAPDALNEIAKLFCEMKTEFDKHGFVITTTARENPFDLWWRPTYETNHSVSNLARCCDHVAFLRIIQSLFPCRRLSSLKRINSSVDLFIKRGLPPSKILITIPAMGSMCNVLGVVQRKEDSNGSFTLLGTTIIEMLELPGNFFHRDIMRIIRNTSMEWIVHRDEETKEPYAVTKTRLWASYDDTTSMEYKAKYVLEMGLGGIGICSIDMEDSEGTTGEGRFPLTRAAYNALSRGLQTVENSTEQT